MSVFHEKTETASRGKWRGILMELGVPRESLTGRHCACPLCGGTDRWRFDDLDRRGTSICNQCGAMSGMKLAMELLGQDFQSTASRIDQMVGNIKPEAGQLRKDMSDDDRKQMLRAAVMETKPVQSGDLVDRYLTARGIGETVYPSALRFGAAMRDGEGGIRPCIVALVGVHGETDERGRQRYQTLHRTFLKPDGSGKAEMASPRKLMPGSLTDGACVMLSEWTGSGPIGIAEGIETARAASQMFGLPVWAAINATMLAKWRPPVGADEVVIFADSDRSATGMAAAFALARSVATISKLPWSVQCPGVQPIVQPAKDTDWLDQKAKETAQ